MSKTFLRGWHNYEEVQNPGYYLHSAVGGSRWYELECGHMVKHKLSRPLAQRVKCRRCEQMSSGMNSVEYDLEAGVTREEKWQPGPQLPMWIVTRHSADCMRGIYHDNKECVCNSKNVERIYPKRLDK